VLFAPFVALISRQIRRSSPRLELLADVQLICCVIGIVIVLLFELLLGTIAFRPDMSPLLTFWVVLGSFGLWVSVMCWSMIRAIPPEASGPESKVSRLPGTVGLGGGGH
jgi:hypothetical protein